MRKKLLQIGVPAVCGVLLLILTIAAPWKSGGKDTPVRVGTQGITESSLHRFYDLEDAILHSDLVADITIASWLGENSYFLGQTYFNVKVNNVLKGAALEEFILVQEGNSKSTVRNYPLFQKGDRLLLFLNEYDGTTDEHTDFDTVYWIIGAYSTVMDIQSVDGTLYAIDRWGGMTSEDRGYHNEDGLYIEVIKPRHDLTTLDSATASRTIQRRDEADPVLAQMDNSRNRVLLYDEVLNYVQKINKGGTAE
ncbi:MAG: hypothetical protein FWG31_00400 [Oscillospiraceae bacterium]|nr:hypothetical protein [Oscillospiraceae bacterium]